jgi:hypothetical protein
MEGMRKFWAGVVYEGVLVLVLAAMIALGKLTTELFVAWGSMFAGGFAAYIIGNVVSKFSPPVPPTP